MKRTPWIPAALWAASLAIAFVVGRSVGTGQAGAAGKSSSATAAGASSSSSSARGGSFGTGPGASKTPTKPAEFAKELKAALEDPDLIQRGLRLMKLLEGLGPKNLDSVLAAFDGLDGDSFENLEAFRLLIYAWSRFDPKSAMGYAIEKLGMRGTFVAQPAMANWVRADADGALAWAKGLGGNQSQFAVGGVLYQLASIDPADAAKRLATIEGGAANARYAEMIAGQYARKDPVAAAAWAQTLTDPNAQRDALDRVAREWVEKDPAAAAAWVAQGAAQLDMSDAARRVAQQMASQDPAQAITWANRLPQGDERTSALSSAVGEWAEKDPNAAGNWLNNNITAGPDGDRLISSYARNISDQDPAAAVQWAGSISDEGYRSRATVELARNWYRQDQKAAEAWLQSAPLSEEQKREVTRPSRFGDFRGGPGGGPGGPPWRR
ncbi:MAG: hypothetical protein IT577_13215 [Verrucomicrobiae bacterium]|nr:hypothetical protein [Verrucomicrobiae bacterium]